MKTIIVTSDTHGKVENLYHIYKKNKKADMFIHLGDYASDAVAASARLGTNVECVKANGDIGSQLPLAKEFIVDRNKILAVHGHVQRVKYSLLRLNFMAREANADIVLFGHTHMSLVENNGILFVNPGFGYRGEYAVVTIEKGVANAKIMQL
ncbi:MAG: YfcE family phosphodiesterase [Eubacteriales bacterium]